MNGTHEPPVISLLRPAQAKASTEPEQEILIENAGNDLGINPLIERLKFPAHLRAKLRTILLTPVSDPETIRYRQEVLEDCLNNPSLIAGLAALMPKLAHLGYLSDYPFHTYMEQVTARLGELEVYVECVHMASIALEEEQVTLHSEGLLRLKAMVQSLKADAAFQDLAEQLPELRKKAAGVTSISIGINLDNQLRPYEATLLSINDRPYTGEKDTFLSRLFRSGSGTIKNNAELRGIARLHSAPNDIPEAVTQAYSTNGRVNPLILPLFQDLDRILRQTMEPVAHALQDYITIQSRFLRELELELAFYLGGAQLVQQMRAAGLPMCRAEIAPIEERVCQIKDLYNLYLALRMHDQQGSLANAIVTNPAVFGEEGRILILTGPNQGGKTTFTQAVGLAQALFQVGLYIPASQARISPVDHILTMFPLEEQPYAEVGRLGEEAQRLSKIFKSATRYSLVLLNEALTTTSPGESIYLARDILRALRLYGVRAVFVTHLHELAENIDALHATSSGDSRFASLVAGIVETDEGNKAPVQEDTNRRSGELVEPEITARRTYQIRPAPPIGMSFANDIARRHGISFEQLAQELDSRKAQEDATHKDAAQGNAGD